MNEIVIVSIAIVLCLLICILVILGAKSYVSRNLEKASRLLEQSYADICKGQYTLDETLESKLHHQLKTLFTQMAQEHQSISEEKEDIKSFVADLSHQIKTPLANITLYTQLLQQEELSDAEKADFELRLDQEIEKISFLIKTLTKATRLETGAIAFAVEDESLSQTVTEAALAMRAKAAQKQIAVEVDIKEQKEIRVRHNKNWTEEVITNILENAIKYSDENTKITVSIRAMELYTVVDISDQGIGIDAKDYNRIFKRFYRGENVSGQIGSGLGLYLAQLIMNRQDGYIVVASRIEKGSTFSLYFKK